MDWSKFLFEMIYLFIDYKGFLYFICFIMWFMWYLFIFGFVGSGVFFIFFDF